MGEEGIDFGAAAAAAAVVLEVVVVAAAVFFENVADYDVAEVVEVVAEGIDSGTFVAVVVVAVVAVVVGKTWFNC